MADENQESITDNIFPKDSGKSYALVEMMPRESPMVGRGPDDTVFSFPVVLLWEVILLLGVTLAIFLFSLVKEAPLGEIANPMVTTDPAKAPWYFVGLQELLEHMHPMVAGILVPGILVLFLLLLPYIDYSRAGVGIWFSSRRGKLITLFTALYTVIAIPLYMIIDNQLMLREALRGKAPIWVSEGILPFAMLMAFVLLPQLVLWRIKANRREVMLALFTVMFVSAVIFTLSGFLLRGPGFKLYWPWDMPNGYNPWNDF